MYNDLYVIVKTLVNNTLCKIKLAQFIPKPERQYCLKVFNKKVLRSVKEYRRKKGGRGMEAYFPQVEKLYKCEINAMAVMASDLQHPNVVHIHEIIDDIMENDKIIVAMEYCPGG